MLKCYLQTFLKVKSNKNAKFNSQQHYKKTVQFTLKLMQKETRSLIK